MVRAYVPLSPVWRMQLHLRMVRAVRELDLGGSGTTYAAYHSMRAYKLV